MKRLTYISICIFFLNLFSQSSLMAKEGFKERIYLQTDKSVYLAGELMWLKAYLVNNSGNPSDISKIGYIELLDESLPFVQIKIEIQKGLGTGWIQIPVTLSTGNYRLVAYTRNMLNEGEEVFFAKNVSIINTFKAEEHILINTDSVNTKHAIDISSFNVNVTSDKTFYSNRDKGFVNLENLPLDVYSLSVSIAGTDITGNEKTVNIGEWNSIIKNLNTSYSGEWIPEYEGHIITGKLIQIKEEKETKFTPFIGLPGNKINVFAGKIEEDNLVSFYTHNITGTQEIVTNVISEKNTYRLDIQSPYAFHSEVKLPIFKLQAQWEKELLKRSVGLQVLQTYMTDSLSILRESESNFRYKPDWSFLLDHYTRFTTMEEVVVEFVTGLRFRRINNKRYLSVFIPSRNEYSLDNSLVLIDGVIVSDHELIYKYNPLLVERIDVYSGRYIWGEQVFEGIAAFWTYENNYPSLKLDSSIQFFDYEGTQPYRYFYAPQYNSEEEIESPLPDFRHTLLWEPYIETPQKTSITIPFTTSDLTGDFLVTVEGITIDGKPIYGNTIFQVNKGK